MERRDVVMFRFGAFALEPAAFRLTKDGAPLHIEPKALEVLLHLVERRERVVSKQELLDEVWKETAVTENALTRVVAHLRRVLGDDADAPRFVQTVPTKGYRFIAEVTEVGNETPVVVDVVEPPPVRKASWRRTALIVLTLVLLLAAVAIVALRVQYALTHDRPGRAAEAPARQLVGRPLRADARLQVYPAFSPDRVSIAYSADADGTPHIYVSALSGANERQLTSGDDGQTQPAWSPDGQWLAYVSIARGGIWIVPAAGGAPRQLTAFGSRPAWSPDGSEIAFQSGNLLDHGWGAFDALPPSEIWVADVRTGRASALTRAGMPPGGHGSPSWRHDGAMLTFTSCDVEHCGVYTIARNGAPPHLIASDARRLSSPLFSRDGRSIFHLLVLYGSSSIWSVDVTPDGRGGERRRRLRETSGAAMQHLALSPDGWRFAWSALEERSELAAVDVRDGALRAVTPAAIGGTLFPAFSPDGAKVAYCAAAAGEDSGVWITTIDGGETRPLAAGPRLKQYTQWDRGGWDVLYAAWQPRGTTLYRSSLVDGRTSTVAVLPHGGSAPRLSPDGTTIAFNRTMGGNTTVWTMKLDGSDARQRTTEHDLARTPVWSPTGGQLAVQQRRRNGIGIVSMGGSAMRLLPFEGESWPWSWSPDERQVAFAGRRDGRWNVWTIDVASGAARPLTSQTSMSAWIRTPAWSPRGDQIVFERGTTTGGVWISQERVGE